MLIIGTTGVGARQKFFVGLRGEIGTKIARTPLWHSAPSLAQRFDSPILCESFQRYLWTAFGISTRSFDPNPAQDIKILNSRAPMM